MSTESRPANWFLRENAVESAPLGEVELRRRLAQASEDELQSMEVRQGSSPWFPARSVLQRFKDLADNGIYLLQDGSSSGPFTAQRAYELLSSPQSTATQFRLGRQGDWLPAEEFLQRVAAATGQTLPLAQSTDPIFKATLIDNDVDSSFFPATIIAPSQPGGAIPTGRAVSPPVGRAVSPPVGRAVAQRQPAPPISHSLPQVSQTAPLPTPSFSHSAASNNSFRTIAIVLGIGAALLLILAGTGAALYVAGVFPGGSTELSETGGSASPIADSGSNTGMGPWSSTQTGNRPPIITPGALFRPTFQTFDGIADAGTAFAARLPGSSRPIVLSALHLLGPAGGLPNDIPPREIPIHLRGLTLTDCITQQDLGFISGRALGLLATAPFPEVSPMGDVVAYFPSEVGSFQPLPLATVEPRSGETVWLVSEVLGSNAITHPAVIKGIEDGWLVYEFTDSAIELRATSGAPVVNGQQQVIAINAGGGTNQGKTIGIGTPVSRFLLPLTQAVGAQ